MLETTVFLLKLTKIICLDHLIIEKKKDKKMQRIDESVDDFMRYIKNKTKSLITIDMISLKILIAQPHFEIRFSFNFIIFKVNQIHYFKNQEEWNYQESIKFIIY
jgi:hypothetical protein